MNESEGVESLAVSETITDVGLVLVHGIGEQKRFEHLDYQGRQIIQALCADQTRTATVEIEAPSAAMFHAEQATWEDSGAGALQVVVAHNGKVTHRIHIHEVWWADVNESYSIAKQFRFWCWGLAVWAFPTAKGKSLAGQSKVFAASLPGNLGLRDWIWIRTRLFFVAVVFALAGPTIGLLMALLQRLLSLRATPILHTVTNYLSGVKLFLQPHRHGTGFFGNQDFLDTLDEPPRVSVRRRMIHTIAQVALQEYDRWYVVAHSQGTVLALNGLMETAEAWPGYFTEAQWTKLRSQTPIPFCGAAKSPFARGELPSWPAWNTAGEVAFRTRIFDRFHGLLTLGSPLQKFATIWPERVPIARTPAFRPGTFWINVFDPIDPVSGLMDSFRAQAPTQCPQAIDIGYRSDWKLLIAHLKYLERYGKGYLADGVAQLLLSGNTDAILGCRGSFAPHSRTHHVRRAFAFAWWIGALVVIAVLARLAIAYARHEQLKIWHAILKATTLAWTLLWCGR